MFSCFSCNLEYKSSQLYLAAYNPLTLEALSMPGVPGFMIFWLRLVIKVANVLSLPKRELSLVCPSATCLCFFSWVSFPLVWFFHCLSDILNLRYSFLKSPNFICILIFVWKDLNLLTITIGSEEKTSLFLFVTFLLGVSSRNTWF